DGQPCSGNRGRLAGSACDCRVSDSCPANYCIERTPQPSGEGASIGQITRYLNRFCGIAYTSGSPGLSVISVRSGVEVLSERKKAMARKKLIAANWKMYKNPEQTKGFFKELLPLIAGHDRDEVVVCPPYVDLHVAIEQVKSTQIRVGAQDVYWQDEGAFTGE